jgi:hypothetical protein
VSLEALAQRAGLQVTGHSRREQRRAWAAAIRASIREFPAQAAFAQSASPLVAGCGTRRTGKTTGIGTELTARTVERDDYFLWVFTDTLQAFTRNWVRRGYNEQSSTGGKRTGLLQMLAKYEIPYKASRYSKDAYTGIEFPWGSRWVILPAGDAGKLEDARGGDFDCLWLDEAQKMDLLTAILEEMAGPAGNDYDAQIFMTGTPGDEVGSYFHRAVTGEIRGIDVHDIGVWQNPHYGTTFRERFENGVMRPLRKLQDTYGIRDEDLDKIATLQEDELTIRALTAQPWVERLPAKVRREFLRLWVHNANIQVYPSEGLEPWVRYWGEWAPEVTAEAVALGTTAETMKRQTSTWPARIAKLPHVVAPTGQEYAKRWWALLGIDLGTNPDPFALWLGVFSPQDPNLYELESGKANDLRDDQQLDVLRHWLSVLRASGLRLWGAVIDDDGGNTPAQVNGWRHKLAPLLPATGLIGAYKPKKRMQERLLNDERYAGRVKMLRNSPTDLEEQYLQREPFDPQHPDRKRDTDKHRRVAMTVTHESGRRELVEVAPGDHCLDGRRYVWYWATHIHGQIPTEDAEPTTLAEAWDARIRKRLEGKR